MIDREKVFRIIDELIFEAQKEQTWKAENALRCLKKELLKEQEVVRCKDCKKIGYTNCHWFCKWLNRCVDEDWYCADGERRSDDGRG